MFVRLIEPGAKGFDEIRIDSFDTWSMDITLAEIIVPMLKQLKNDKHGMPSELMPQDHYSDQYVFEFVDQEAEFEMAEKRWDEIMGKMIWSFERVAKGEWHSARVPEQFQAEYGHDWKRFNDDIQAGINLFAKHYGNLWD